MKGNTHNPHTPNLAEAIFLVGFVFFPISLGLWSLARIVGGF